VGVSIGAGVGVGVGVAVGVSRVNGGVGVVVGSGTAQADQTAANDASRIPAKRSLIGLLLAVHNP